MIEDAISFCNDEQIKKFEIYYNELIEYNKNVNLTAITEKQEVYIKHFYDSCLANNLIKKNAKVLDIGTGAGFPGVPLKIIREDIELTLVDSLNKRVNFLNYLCDKVSIKAECVHSRAEEYAHGENREKFDVVVARAVASLNTLLEYTLPLLKVGGIFIAYKGANFNEELIESKSALKVLGGKIQKVEEKELPYEYGKRALIVIKKLVRTNNKYPRNKNLPKLRPL